MGTPTRQPAVAPRRRARARRRRRTGLVVVLLACLAVFAVGGSALRSGLQAQSPEPTPQPEQAFSISAEQARAIDPEVADAPLAVPGTDLGPHARTADPGVPPAPPSHLSIPSIHVLAPVVAQGITDENTMSLPEDLGAAGWLRTTAPLGAEEGTTVLAGHVTSGGQRGALYFLGKVRPGAGVVTTDEGGRQTRWVVTSARNHRKSALPEGIFATSGPRRLALVTCGGAIRQGTDGTWTHEDNIVVTAVPAQ